MSGATPRAVFLSEDWRNVCRFFRTQRNVTIVKGKGDYDGAASRISDRLKPWAVRCIPVSAADVARPLEIAEAPFAPGAKAPPLRPTDADGDAQVADRGPVREELNAHTSLARGRG